MSENPVLAAIENLRADMSALRADMSARFDSLEAKVNDGNEGILDRLSAVEADVRNLHSEHSVTRDLVMKLPATVLGAIEQPLLNRITAIERRVSKLDGEP